jgi:hypothetical protein
VEHSTRWLTGCWVRNVPVLPNRSFSCRAIRTRGTHATIFIVIGVGKGTKKLETLLHGVKVGDIRFVKRGLLILWRVVGVSNDVPAGMRDRFV